MLSQKLLALALLSLLAFPLKAQALGELEARLGRLHVRQWNGDMSLKGQHPTKGWVGKLHFPILPLSLGVFGEKSSLSAKEQKHSLSMKGALLELKVPLIPWISPFLGGGFTWSAIHSTNQSSPLYGAGYFASGGLEKSFLYFLAIRLGLERHKSFHRYLNTSPKKGSYILEALKFYASLKLSL